jgi:uncharacterized membrane protein YkvA (DUF1232 family)
MSSPLLGEGRERDRILLASVRYRLEFEGRILAAVMLDWRPIALLCKLVLILGVTYLFVPLDLIPDRIPVIGHLDEAGFLAAGIVLCRRLSLTAVRSTMLAQMTAGAPGWREPAADDGGSPDRGDQVSGRRG